MPEIMPRAANRPDPAPSRWAYRYNRWMLTPTFRFALRVVLPFAVVAGATAIYFADQDRRDQVLLAYDDIKLSIQQRPEFMVNAMTIDGASSAVMEDIREVLPIDFPVSSFDLDLEDIRATVVSLDPVESVKVKIKPGGVMSLDVRERTPVVIWRTREGLELLAANGAPVREVEDRADYSDLPLIAGDGADRHVGEALRVLRAAAPLAGRVRGLVRMGDRRWDLVLDRDQRIMLPQDNPVQAVERVIVLNDAETLLKRDLIAVDMRLTDRPTLRMAESAAQQLWGVNNTSAGEQKDD